MPSADEQLLDLALRRDAGVVGAEDPLRAPAAHAVVRIRTSWIVQFSAWPMCSAPVTFGGGIAIEKFSSALPAASGCTRPDSSQRARIRGSTSAGSNRVRACRSPVDKTDQSMERQRRPIRSLGA